MERWLIREQQPRSKAISCQGQGAAEAEEGAARGEWDVTPISISAGEAGGCVGGAVGGTVGERVGCVGGCVGGTVGERVGNVAEA